MEEDLCGGGFDKCGGKVKEWRWDSKVTCLYNFRVPFCKVQHY